MYRWVFAVIVKPMMLQLKSSEWPSVPTIWVLWPTIISYAARLAFCCHYLVETAIT